MKALFVLASVWFGFSLARVPQTPLGVDYQGPAVSISHEFLASHRVKFVDHSAGSLSWLGLALDFKWIEPVIKELNTTEFPLKTRGESHITVITPPEFAVLATANVTIEQINRIALQHSIQSSPLHAVCLGKEDVVLKDNRHVVYQIIFQVPNLVKIRQAIFQVYVKQGGNTALFDPYSFWPHSTVAFTSSDLFLEQGVYKGANVCHRPIRWIKASHQ
ncbi:hypothetical protein BY458DRAFT_516527 [Sporodiniella umbellata]|nr:hypothetical protein BY458DRAFT_516527 [Sporodiniella umbellata]